MKIKNAKRIWQQAKFRRTQIATRSQIHHKFLANAFVNQMKLKRTQISSWSGNSQISKIHIHKFPSLEKKISNAFINKWSFCKIWNCFCIVISKKINFINFYLSCVLSQHKLVRNFKNSALKAERIWQQAKFQQTRSATWSQIHRKISI